MPLNIKLLIIVPVYNTELYVGEFIDSLKAQTFRDFIVLLINDGSTDQSLKILENLTSDDNRFKILSKSNGGVSSARNYGLNFIKRENFHPEYVYFCDSDDVVGSNTLSLCINALDKTHADLAIFSVAELTKKGIIYTKKKFLKKEIISGDDIVRQYFRYGLGWRKNSTSEAFLNNKVFRYSVISNQRFDENLRRAEDFDFYLNILPSINNAVLCQKAWFYYRKRKSSLTQTKIAYNDLKVCLKHYFQYKNFSTLAQKLIQHRLYRAFYLAIYSKIEEQRWDDVEELISFFKKFNFCYHKTLGDLKIKLLLSLPKAVIVKYMKMRNFIKKRKNKQYYFR